MPKNLLVAYALYNLAASAGNDIAKGNIARLEPAMSATDLRKAQDLSTKLYNSKSLIATLDAFVKANPWREPVTTKQALPSSQQPRPISTTGVRPRCINPATGLPMVATDGSCVGIDVMDNPLGVKLN